MGGRGGGGIARSSAEGPTATQAPTGTPTAAGTSPQDQILQAYSRLQSGPVEWVALADLRRELGGLNREQQDRALIKLATDRRIRLIPEENQKTITPADQAASIRLSGENKHLISSDERAQ